MRGDGQTRGMDHVGVDGCGTASECMPHPVAPPWSGYPEIVVLSPGIERG